MINRTDGTQGRSTKTKVAVVCLKELEGVGGYKPKRWVHWITKPYRSTWTQMWLGGSTLSTDEVHFYRPVEGDRKIHVNHSVSEYVNEMASTNGIESVWAEIKRGYYGTYHHFSKKHIDRYINEFTFRLNEGNCWISTMDRIRSLSQSSQGKRLTYKGLIAKAS